MARAITAFGLPWHVLTCSRSARRSLSLLTVHCKHTLCICHTGSLVHSRTVWSLYDHPPPPPSPNLRVLAAAVCSFYCLEIGFLLTALIGCVEDYLCVTHPFSARRPAPRPELPGNDSSCCYSGVGTRAQSRNSCMHVSWFLAPCTLVPLELPELLRARLIHPL